MLEKCCLVTVNERLLPFFMEVYMFWIWFACQPTPPVSVESVVDSRPDVLLITIDTLRADRIGAYGDTLAVTPNLDRFAKEGWLYTESHAITPLTLPSHTSILTGLPIL